MKVYGEICARLKLKQIVIDESRMETQRENGRF
jgi:hypothetical protein